MTERLKDFVDIVGKSLYINEREDGAHLTVVPHWFTDETLVKIAHSNGHAEVQLSTEKLLQLRDYLNSIFTNEPRVYKPGAGGELTISSGPSGSSCFVEREESPEEKAYSDVKVPHRALALQKSTQEDD